MHNLAIKDPQLARAQVAHFFRTYQNLYFFSRRYGSDSYLIVCLDDNRETKKGFECPGGYPASYLDNFDAFFFYRGKIIEFRDAQSQVCRRCSNGIHCLLDPFAEEMHPKPQTPGGFSFIQKLDIPPYWTPLKRAT